MGYGTVILSLASGTVGAIVGALVGAWVSFKVARDSHDRVTKTATAARTQEVRERAYLEFLEWFEPQNAQATPDKAGLNPRVAGVRVQLFGSRLVRAGANELSALHTDSSVRIDSRRASVRDNRALILASHIAKQMRYELGVHDGSSGHSEDLLRNELRDSELLRQEWYGEDWGREQALQ